MLLTINSANASGGMACDIDDATVQLNVRAGVTHGMGSPTFNFRAELTVLNDKIAEDMRRVTFDVGDRPQYWLDDKELRLVLYKERVIDKAFGSVELIIRTTADDDGGSFAGTYKLSIADATASTGSDSNTIDYTGAVTCFAE
ncbi:MAG: hypothetical protein ACTHNN_16215 [Xanthobacteraceae bacterium]